MARILLMSVDRALAQAIKEAMGDRATVDLCQTIDPAQLEGPVVIVVDRSAIPPEHSVSAALGAIVGQSQERPVVLATDRQDSEEVLRAIRSGASDVLPRDASGMEIAEVLGRLINQVLVEQGKGGQLTLVLGPDHDAAAVVATDLALARARERSPVLLIDCNLPTSACEAYLDLKVSYGLASAIADIERLDASLLASALARHGQSGLMLLTLDGGTGAEPVGIQPADIAALVKLLRTCCADVIFCAGSLRHAGVLRELGSAAERIELVCAQSLRQLEAARRMIDRIAPDTTTMERTRLLVWDYQPGVLLDGRRMGDALGITQAVNLPLDQVRLRNAANFGRPLALESDGGAYMQAIRRLSGLDGNAVRVPGNRIGKLTQALRRVTEAAR